MNFKKFILSFPFLSLLLLVIQCEKIKYQYWDNGNIKVKEVCNRANTTKYYYNENGNIIIDIVNHKNGKSIKRHYSEKGNVDIKEVSNLDGVVNEYHYDFDGKLLAEATYDETGLILMRNYLNEVLVSEEHFFNKNHHGLCSQYYCQDGSLKYQCIFKNGQPYSGIWPLSSKSIGIESFDNLYFKYTEGKKEKFDFKPNEFPYIFCHNYNVISLKDNIYRLDLNVRTSTTTCERHGDGEFTLKSAKIIGYDSLYIKLIALLTFKVISTKPSWILLKGITQDDTTFLDSISITYDSTGILLTSEIEVKPEASLKAK